MGHLTVKQREQCVHLHCCTVLYSFATCSRWSSACAWLQAVLGAIYVDGGWQESRKVYLSHFAMSPDIREALAEYGCKSVLDMTHSEKVQKAMPKSAIRMKAYLMSQKETKARRSKQ